MSQFENPAYELLKTDLRIEQTARILLDAREKCEPIADLDPALRPSTLEEAYAIQDVMADQLGTIGGWKIGAPSPEATPMFAPMPFNNRFVSNGGELPAKESHLRGIEAEIAFLLRKDLPARTERYSREEILDAIAAAYPAIEILESAYINPDKVQQLSMIADLQVNGGFVHGHACQDWHSIDIASEPVEVVIDSVVRWNGVGQNSNGRDLLRLIDWLANEGQYRTGGLQVGQWITTGSWMGKLYAHAHSSVEVRFPHFGSAAFSFNG